MKRIYLFRFMMEFIPVAPVYAVMFASRDLTTFEISMLIAVWSITALLFEVPSGVLADKYDRRHVLFVGQVLTVFTFVVWWWQPNVWGYAVGFLLWGLGGALDSGTFEALLYDELADRGEEQRFADVLGRTDAANLIAVVASSLVAAVLIRNGYDAILLVSAIGVAASAAIVLTLDKAPPREESEDRRYFSMLWRGIRQAAVLPMVMRCIAVLATAGSVLDLVSEYAPLFVTDQGIAVSSMALFFAAFVLLMAGVSAVAPRLPGSSTPFWLQIVFCGVLLGVATMCSGWLSVIVYGSCALSATITGVMARADLQHRIDGELRATTTSVGGFVQEALNVGGLFAFGLLADGTDRSTAFRALSVVIILAGVTFWLRTAPIRHDSPAVQHNLE